MDAEFLSNFMKSSTNPNHQQHEHQVMQKEPKFSIKLAQLQLQYKEQLELCGKYGEELKLLVSKHRIANERLWLLGEEISLLLVHEQSKKEISASSACAKVISKMSEHEMNSFSFPKDEELFGTCPLVLIDAKNAIESAFPAAVAAESQESNTSNHLSERDSLAKKQRTNIMNGDLLDSTKEISFNSLSNESFLEMDSASYEFFSSNGIIEKSSANSIQNSSTSNLSKCPFQVRKSKNVTVFTRKPRFISFFPEGNHSSDFMVSASFDGALQFWKCTQSKGPSVFQKQLLCSKQKMIPEDIHWNSADDSFAVACISHAEKESYLKLFHRVHHNPKNDQLTGQFALHKADCHTKSLKCISSIPSSTTSLKYLSAGEDKTVFLWSFSRENIRQTPQIQTIHSGKHTSVIQCMHFDKNRNCLYSGGADGRLIGFSLERETLSENWNQLSINGKIPIRNHRITNIQPRPLDSNVLLLTQSTNSNQFILFDLRCHRQFQSFGWNESSNISQYVTPSWHQSGNYVACGSVSENNVNIWDVRFTCLDLATSTAVSPSLPLATNHPNGRILNSIFHPTKSILATCSTADQNVNFIDYILL